MKTCRGSLTFRVDGEVVGSARPRVTRNGTYTPKRTRDYRKRIARAFTEAGGEMHDGPHSVGIDVYRALPKSRPKRVESEPDTFKPDVDNICKNVLDALNGVAWPDDSCVTGLRVVKWPRRRCEECIEVTVTWL